jgi:hypothetical protein
MTDEDDVYMNKFYQEMEPAVRPIVKLMRDHGFNTKWSCGHVRYVELEAYSEGDAQKLLDLLVGKGYRDFWVNLRLGFLEGQQYGYIRVDFGKHNPGLWSEQFRGASIDDTYHRQSRGWDVYVITDLEKWAERGQAGYDSIGDVDEHDGGGYYIGQGIKKAKLNVTYEHIGLLCDTIDGLDQGLETLNKQPVGDWIDRMERAVEKLGTDRDEVKYWTESPGNVGYVLSSLLCWARQYPDGYFIVH